MSGEKPGPDPANDNPAVDYRTLRSNVSQLGSLLGETIAAAEGEDFLALVEQIRVLSKSARTGDDRAREELLSVLRNLDNERLLPVARAFAQFLNLANTDLQGSVHDVDHQIAATFMSHYSSVKASGCLQLFKGLPFKRGGIRSSPFTSILTSMFDDILKRFKWTASCGINYLGVDKHVQQRLHVRVFVLGSG